MTLLNGWLRQIFDALLRPLAAFPPLVVLAAISLLTSVGVLLLFKTTSDQKKLADVKRRIHACLFEIRLLRDDARGILRAQGEMLLHQGNYLRLGLAPLLLSAVVLLPVMAQLQFHYGYQGLQPGSEAMVTVRLKPRAARWRRPEAQLTLPAGLAATTPAVWLPALGQVCWGLRAERGGDYRIDVRVDGESVAKSLRVSSDWGRRSPVRLAPGLVNQILYPAEDPLPAGSGIESISVAYAPGSVSLAGWHTHWLVAFFALSVVFTFALRRPLRVVL